MSIVAWDGQSLASDKRGVNNGMPKTHTKMARLQDGTVVAWVGDLDKGLALLEWYKNGRDPEKWPAFQSSTDTFTRLVVASRSGARTYETQPYPIPVEDPYDAWGSGRDFAITALHLGKSAKEAVEVASLFDVNCGNGVDCFDIA